MISTSTVTVKRVGKEVFALQKNTPEKDIVMTARISGERDY